MITEIYLKSYELSTRGYNHVCMPNDLHDHQKSPGQLAVWRVGYSDCHTPSGVHRDMLYIHGLSDPRFPDRPMISDNDSGTGSLLAAQRGQKTWACLTAGGHSDYFHFEAHEYPVLISQDVTDGMRYVGYVNKFIKDLSVRLSGMTPRDDLVTNGWCLARSGDEYVIYLISGGSTTVSNLPSPSYTAIWFNPRDGMTYSAGNGPIFTAPDSNDWALHITSGAPTTQLPYHGTPAAVPGTIQAEDYDLGGQIIAYSDNSSGNAGGQYRSDDVDIEVTTDTGGGYNVGWIGDDEWLEFTVDVASAGLHNFGVRVAADPAACTSIDFHIKMNGQDVTGPQSTTPTTGGQDFKTVAVPGVTLEAGEQILRFAMDSDSWNVNWIETTLVQAFVQSDFDRDYDVDQEDFGFFQQCYSGFQPYAEECAAADLDGSGNINIDDFDIFYPCMGEADQLPNC